MAVVSVVKLSQIEGTLRVDADYYQPQYIEIKNKLSAIKNLVRLRDVAIITTGPAYSSKEMGEHFGIPIARIGDVTNKTTIEDWIKLSEKEFEKFNRKKIENLDTLMTMTGDPPDVGKCNLIKISNDDTIAFNQRIAKISARISPYYLFAYLSLEIARMQSERNALGIRQRNVGINDLKNIFVVLPLSDMFCLDIDNLVTRYLSETELSKSLYFQAENLLLDELGLQDFKPKYDLSYTANLSQAFGARRVDAEYFQPAYEQVTGEILGYQNGYTPLLGCVKAVRADFDPAKHPHNSFHYVELADIDASIGVIHSVGEVKGDEAPSRARRVLKREDVIVSSVEGSLEKVALVDEEHEGSLASTGFFQFRVGTIRPEVLLVLSKSIILQAQLKRECAGTILTAVPNESLKRIFVPVLPREIQQKITSLIQQSHEARRKAKELLEEAKSKVEQMIETASTGND